MQWEINPATILLIVVQTVGVIVAFVRAYDNAAAAKKKADEVATAMYAYKKDTEASHVITTAGLALIREQFVRKEDLQHLEASIARQFDSLQKRLDTYFMNKAD